MGDIADLYDFDFDPSDLDAEGDGRQTHCKRCGRSGLYWSATRGGWALFDDDTDEKHVCAFGPSGQTAGAEEFD